MNSGVASTGASLDSEKIAKNLGEKKENLRKDWETRGKSGKNQEKEEKSGRKGKIGKVLSLCPS